MRGPAAPGDATRALRLSRWPRLVLLYSAICPPAAALLYLAFLPMWEGHPLLALGSAALSVALLTAGILLLDEPGQRGPASMLIASSALLAAGLLNIWRAGPLPLVSVPASPAGTILAAWAIVLPRRDRWLFLAAWAGFTVAQAANREAWQRYYEPFVLILFALASVRLSVSELGPSAAPQPRSHWPDVGPLLLACLLAAISIAALR